MVLNTMNFKQNEGTYECELMQLAHLLFHKKLIPSFFALLLGLCIGIRTLQNLLHNAAIENRSSALAFPLFLMLHVPGAHYPSLLHHYLI